VADAVQIQGAVALSPYWWLGRLIARLDGRQTEMALADDYYHGRHRKTYKIRQVMDAFGLRNIPLFVNYCGVVVDAVNERLGVNGFRFAKDDAAAAAAWEVWQASNLDAGYKRGLRVGLTKGEFGLIVWPDSSGEPKITVEDGSEVIVATDPADRRIRRAALKRWEDEGRTFATLYLPDAIYKFQSAAGSIETPKLGDLPEGFGKGGGAGKPQTMTAALAGTWEKRTVPDEEWPLPNPFATVPVFALPNRPDLHGVGESEIAQLIPIQDAINVNVANVMLAGLYGAFRQKYATNVTLEVDESTGKTKEPWDVAIDKLITAPPPADGSTNETKFGEFDQSELTGYIGVHEALVQALATITRLPVHYLLGSQGTFPSGESLTAAERGLSEKARERMVDFGDPTEDAIRFSFRVKASQPGLAAARKEKYLRWAAITDAEIVPRDPETKPESAHYDALSKLMALKVPIPAIWARIPATPQEIADWTAELEKTQKAEAEAAAKATSALAAANSSGTGGPEPGIMGGGAGPANGAGVPVPA
jgi:hypothetical protein